MVRRAGRRKQQRQGIDFATQHRRQLRPTPPQQPEFSHTRREPLQQRRTFGISRLGQRPVRRDFPRHLPQGAVALQQALLGQHLQQPLKQPAVGIGDFEFLRQTIGGEALSRTEIGPQFSERGQHIGDAQPIQRRFEFGVNRQTLFLRQSLGQRRQPVDLRINCGEKIRGGQSVQQQRNRPVNVIQPVLGQPPGRIQQPRLSDPHQGQTLDPRQFRALFVQQDDFALYGIAIRFGPRQAPAMLQGGPVQPVAFNPHRQPGGAFGRRW